MASNVESGFYWMGYGAGVNGKSWESVPFPPGTRAFHQFIEGNGDGLKARILQQRQQARLLQSQQTRGAGARDDDDDGQAIARKPPAAANTPPSMQGASALQSQL